MARRTLWQRFKNAVRQIVNGNNGGSSNRRVTNNRDSRSVRSSNTSDRRAYINAFKGGRDDLERDTAKDAWSKTRSAFKASASKATPDPKEAQKKKSRKDTKDYFKAKATERKEYNKATNNRYNVDGTNDKAEKLKRRQNVKSRAFNADTAEAEAKHAMKYHKYGESAARGAVSGATFGASDLLAKYGTKGEAKKASEVYQKNKSKGAETAGEIAASLASFGLTSGASKAVVKKALPRTTKFAAKQGVKAAEKLAGKKIIRKAAEKEVKNAVKKGIAKEVTEEAIEKVAKRKAKEVVANLGTDAAINATTGTLYSATSALKDTKGFNKLEDLKDEGVRKELGKNLAKGEALNFAVSGLATVGLPVAGAGIRRLRGGVTEGAEQALKEALAKKGTRVTAGELAERAAKTTDDTFESVNIRDMARKKEPPKPITNEQTKQTLRNYREVLSERLEQLKGEELTEDTARKIANIEDDIRTADSMIGDTTPKVEPSPKAEANAEPSREFDVDEMAGVEERIPTDDLKQTELNDARAEGERVAKEVMENEPIEAGAGARQTAEETAENVAEEEVTQGQKAARKAYEEATGQKFEKGGKPASDDDILDALQKVEASKGKKATRKLSKAASSQVRVSTEDEARIINDMLDDPEAFIYDVVHQKDMYKEVAQDLTEDWDEWIGKLCDVAEGGDWSGKESTKLLYMAQYLSEITDATASAEQDALAKTAWQAIQKLSTNSAQTLNGRRAYAHLSRAGKMESALDDMVHILDDAIAFNRKHRSAMKGLNKFERNSYIRAELLKDTRLRDCLKKLANTKNTDDAAEAYMEMMAVFNTHHKKSIYDVVNQMRYVGMLLNPKTHIRNIGGSGFFAPVRQISNAIRATIEDSIADWAGLEITKHGGLSLKAVSETWTSKPTTEAGKEALAAAERMGKEILGASKYETSMSKGRATTLAGKALDATSDFNSLLLTKEDDFFRMRAFKENYIKSYNRYLKDGIPITDKVKRRIELEALNESQVATLNEANDLAKFLNNISRKGSDANASTLQRWGGRTLNAVMPFEKIPANLMKQSVNYSPLGIAKGALNIRTAATRGDAAMLNRAIDELASGLTGTAIFTLGAALGNWTDWFTTNAGKDDPAAKFKKRQGVQNYSVTVTDPKTGNAVSVTLDWLVPTSATFFSGVELANQLKSGGFNVLDIFGDWGTVASRIAEPVMETSMLSGLHGMLETLRGGYGDDDEQGAIAILAREIAQSYVNSLIPTVAGQFSRTFLYDSDKQILGEGDREYWINSLRSKAGLGNTNILGEALGADTDSYGNVKGKKETVGDYAKSALKNFISPANIQKVDLSEVDKAKLAEYEERVKNGEDPNSLAYLFPKKQNKKSFKLAGEDVNMSNKDVSTYNQAKTTGGEEGMRYVLESVMFNRRTTDEKGKNVPREDAYTKEMKNALMEEFKGKSMREVEEWLYDQPEFKNASPAERQKVINGLWTLDNPYNNTTANASRRVGEQAVYEAQGKDVNEYNFKNEVTESKREALMPAIAAGVLTYEQVVDFDRNAAKVGYYETETGGESRSTYNQGTIMDYLATADLSEEQKEALYDAYYTGKQTYQQALAKQGKKGKGGYRRRGYRRRSGGGSKSTASVPIKPSDFKADKATYKDVASALKTRSSSSKKKTKTKATPTVKVEPPKVKFKKYTV